MVTAGCQSNAFTRQGFLVPVTQQGTVILHMWQGSWIAAWAVGIVVWGGILWAIIFHRKRGNQQLPQQVRYNLPIEILYTVLPFIMVGVLFYFTARDENYIDRLPKHPALTVNVTGFQWSWEFQYPQFRVTGQNGTSQPVTETGAMWSPTATVQHLPVLEIPTGETVQFNLTSIDVIHAFWIVPFEFKRDVVPGFANHFAVTPIKTGQFIGRCTSCAACTTAACCSPSRSSRLLSSKRGSIASRRSRAGVLSDRGYGTGPIRYGTGRLPEGVAAGRLAVLDRP